ncbi:MAG: hypothetical protein Q8K72_09470 [Acidimicrobiales bacterium]|nr:hypothetical protein [Acidimicrobiales bacterium]
MTVIDRTPARRAAIAAAVGLAGAILLAGCGGAAATPAPTPTPTAAPTATPAPTPAPTPKPTPKPTAALAATPEATNSAANGGFAFPADQVLGYYESVGFTCEDPIASNQVTGYTVFRCLKADDATGFTTLVALVVDENGVTGDSFAGVLGTDGKTSPTPEQALEPLAFFLGAMMGETEGQKAGTWLTQHLGEDMATIPVGALLVATYPGDKETGLGYYVEVANEAFLAALNP